MDAHDDRRAAAIERLEARRNFKRHVFVYCAVNLVLIGVWAASGAGFFWPIWVIAGWGIGVALQAWTTYGQRPISEDEIRRETQRTLR